MTATAETHQFTWLHLSDLHVGLSKQSWLWPNLKHLLFDDLKRVHASTGDWDVVIFSGDLTQSGAQDEFDHLDVVLAELWAEFAALGFTPKLLVLPGNHDITRPIQPKAELRLLKRWWTETDLHKEFFEGPPNEYQAAVLDVLKPYSEWEARLSAGKIPLVVRSKGILPGDQSSVIEKNGAKIGIVGLNSTWLQLDGADYTGKLHVDTRQVLAVTGNDARAWCNRNAFNILVTHHPVNWLSSESQMDWNTDPDRPSVKRA